MGQAKQEKDRTEFMKVASEMYDELRQWRAKHPEVSFDEIVEQKMYCSTTL